MLLISFKEIKDYRHAHKYSLLLGNFYQEINKYKNAAKYFAYSNENMFKKQKIILLGRFINAKACN